MLQRIQTIYLLLAGIAIGVLFALPFAKSATSQAGIFEDGIYNLYDHPILTGLVVVGLLLSIAAIFLFNNRKLQLKLTIFLIIISILIPITAMALMMTEGANMGKAKAEIEESLGIFLPLLAIIFGFLAYRGIQKDEKIVRSMDRLR